MSGSVSRVIVIQVLEHVLPSAGISFSVNEDQDTIMIVHNGIPEVTILPPSVPRKMLHRLQHKYAVRIEFFYHPEMCCPTPQTPQ